MVESNKAQIDSYRAREAKKIDKIRHRLQNGQQRSILEFYPEFKGLSEQFHTADIPPRYRTYFQQFPEIDLNFLITLHDSVVVGLEPIPEAEFQKWYGITVDDVVELMKKKVVVVRLSGTLESYVGLEYLDPILKDEPPTSSRADLYSESIAGNPEELLRYKDSCDSAFKEVGIDSGFASRVGPKGIDFIGSLEVNYERLSLLGYGWRLDEIRRNSRSAQEFYRELRREYIARAFQVFRSLNGSVAIPLGEISSSQKAPMGLPFEGTKLLLDRIALERPKTLEEALTCRDEHKPLRAAFRGIDKSVTQGELNLASAESMQASLSEALSEVSELHDKSKERIKKIGWVILGASIAAPVLGPAGVIVGGAVGISQQLFKLDNRIAKLVTRYGKPSYIVGLFELYEDERLGEKVRKAHWTK